MPQTVGISVRLQATLDWKFLSNALKVHTPASFVVSPGTYVFTNLGILEEYLMPAELRGPAYRAALSEAYLELDQICERIAALRARKERLDAVVVALQPVVIASTASAATAPAPAAHPAPVVEMHPERRREARREVATDPLQRQINQALGMAALA